MVGQVRLAADLSEIVWQEEQGVCVLEEPLSLGLVPGHSLVEQRVELRGEGGIDRGFPSHTQRSAIPHRIPFLSGNVAHP